MCEKELIKRTRFPEGDLQTQYARGCIGFCPSVKAASLLTGRLSKKMFLVLNEALLIQRNDQSDSYELILKEWALIEPLGRT